MKAVAKELISKSSIDLLSIYPFCSSCVCVYFLISLYGNTIYALLSVSLIATLSIPSSYSLSSLSLHPLLSYFLIHYIPFFLFSLPISLALSLSPFSLSPSLFIFLPLSFFFTPSIYLDTYLCPSLLHVPILCNNFSTA